MELNISEIEDIPENNIQNPIRVIKNQVPSNKVQEQQQSNSIKAIPRPYAKMVRQQMPEQKPKVSYDDILKNMGMVVVDGKVHLIPNINKILSHPQEPTKQKEPSVNQNYNQNQNQNQQIENSYIYNKYFNDAKNETPNVRVPKNIYEYRDMLIQDIIQKQRIKQIKSTRMIMPNSNINVSSPNINTNMNRLFDFSKRI
jgi:hypothetical protein